MKYYNKRERSSLIRKTGRSVFLRIENNKGTSRRVFYGIVNVCEPRHRRYGQNRTPPGTGAEHIILLFAGECKQRKAVKNDLFIFYSFSKYMEASNGTRTHDLRITSASLYQLSHRSKQEILYRKIYENATLFQKKLEKIENRNSICI